MRFSYFFDYLNEKGHALHLKITDLSVPSRAGIPTGLSYQKATATQMSMIYRGRHALMFCDAAITVPRVACAPLPPLWASMPRSARSPKQQEQGGWANLWARAACVMYGSVRPQHSAHHTEDGPRPVPRKPPLRFFPTPAKEDHAFCRTS